MNSSPISLFRKVSRTFGSCWPIARAQKQLLSTVVDSEVDKFAAEAKEWWRSDGPSQPLHAMNRLRVTFIRNALLGHRLDDIGPPPNQDVFPLAGKKIVDVGCGPGILCEPLARLGAEVVGIEPAETSVHVAQQHASRDPLLQDKLHYECTTLEEYLTREYVQPVDLVVASEVIEHVSNPPLFVDCVSKLVKPGGGCVFTTINRTQLSYLVAIVMAEYVLRAITPGTHEWHKFVTPQELTDMLCDSHMTVTCIKGMSYNPLSRTFSWSFSDAVNYLLYAVKPEEPL